MPHRMNADGKVAYVEWTETDDANLRTLVDKLRGGTNTQKPLLTFKQISSTMNSLSKNGTTYLDGAVRSHWQQLRPHSLNLPPTPTSHQWTEEESENLRSLVSVDQGGTNEESPPLTFKKIAVLMTNLSETGKIFKAPYVSRHWQLIRPGAQNNPPASNPHYVWSKEDDLKLKSLVDRRRGGKNEQIPPLTYSKIAVLMTDWSRNGTIFTEKSVQTHWKRIYNASQRTNANDDALWGVEEVGEMVGNVADFENEADAEGDLESEADLDNEADLESEADLETDAEWETNELGPELSVEELQALGLFTPT
jgi:hypothetical protein